MCCRMAYLYIVQVCSLVMCNVYSNDVYFLLFKEVNKDIIKIIVGLMN
jgi:hypothetical protein